MAQRDALPGRSVTEAELTEWGRRIGAEVEPPLWIALVGPLGAGKTVLARSICHGAGVTDAIPSPSFTLVRRYGSPRTFSIHHVDLFRLSPRDSLEPLGWDDLVASQGLVLVEWADRAAGHQPESRWEIRIGYASGADLRTVVVERLGPAPQLVPW